MARAKLPPITLKEWCFLLVLAAIQFTNIMDFMIIMPLQPRYKVAMPGITPFDFGVIVAAYGFSAGVSGFLGAFFNDRFDRKRLLLILYAGFTIGTFLCGFAPDYWTLVAARVVAGAFGGIMGAVLPWPSSAICSTTPAAAVRPASSCGAFPLPPSSAFRSAWNCPKRSRTSSRRPRRMLFSVQVPFLALAVFCVLIWVLAMFVLPAVRGHLAEGPRETSCGSHVPAS